MQNIYNKSLKVTTIDDAQLFGKTTWCYGLHNQCTVFFYKVPQAIILPKKSSNVSKIEGAHHITHVCKTTLCDLLSDLKGMALSSLPCKVCSLVMQLRRRGALFVRTIRWSCNKGSDVSIFCNVFADITN